MEISPDILSLNGIFMSAEAKYGDISKIIYKGLSGENAVIYIQESLHSFLTDKNYLEDGKPRPEFKNYFEELSFLLLVNCEFHDPFKLEEYAHFTCNVPKLSKYLITKVVVEIKLVQYFCKALERIPLLYSCEIFSEFVPTVDKEEPNQLLEDTHCILYTIANIFHKNKDLRFSDEMDMLLRNVPDFFFYITRLSVDDATKLKRRVLYKRAGMILEKLFSLLFVCHKYDMFEGIYIDKLIDSTTLIVRAVPLDMFLYWAEIELPGGENLQSRIAENAYLIKIKYQHHKPATDLVLSLSPFAAKPKDINEQIRIADVNKIVDMVDKDDENQKRWFQALIFSSFYSNKKAVDCVYKWGKLCDEDDVSRLLNQCVKMKDEEPKELALYCASFLNLEQLIVVTLRHFYNNGFVRLKNHHPNMIVWFNKLKCSDTDSKEEKTKIEKEDQHDLLLFILQDPEFAVYFILSECIKSEFYVDLLHECFVKLKNILVIEDICLNCLTLLMSNEPPSVENSLAYRKLIETFLKTNLMTFELLCGKLICPFLRDYLDLNYLEEMKQLLVILNHLDWKIVVGDGTGQFFHILLRILSRRATAETYDMSMQKVIQEVVHLILNKSIPIQQIGFPFFADDVGKSSLIDFYINHLINVNGNESFLQHSLENINTDDRTIITCQLLQVLPFYVQDEWISICSEMIEKFGVVQLLGILRDMMILLCDYVKAWEKKDKLPKTLEWLKYVIHQLGYALKNKILPLNNEENEILITQMMVMLLSRFPDNLKETEGLNIIHSLMTERSLKHLGNDQQFITNICRIKNTSLCQAIASKILQ